MDHGYDRFITNARHRIDNFVAKASILVLASHGAETCRQFCNKALWIDQGMIKAAGSLEEILEMDAEETASNWRERPLQAAEHTHEKPEIVDEALPQDPGLPDQPQRSCSLPDPAVTVEDG
ncbi:hypothetical protein QA633_31625 [Bradyrhizobium barranii]|uniref:hypothetical protein n=1 Tax=Bradyrhizobium barranii TaxID=2992140 RepID=UPI0024AF8ACB|nr:hypothetical protein [Bradyrhizobium barranii]WFT92853.1 hypothetical protein QA633_31625 [Bradyrhizobium barranii]